IAQDIVRRAGVRTGLYVPLLARERVLGVIGLHDKVGRDARFSDDDLRIGEAFAARAAVAVELSQRVARDALRRVVAAQELERKRLAREPHDETGPAPTPPPLRPKAAQGGGAGREPRAGAAARRAPAGTPRADAPQPAR